MMKDLSPRLQIWQWYIHNPIKPSRSQKRLKFFISAISQELVEFRSGISNCHLIHHVGAVGRSHDGHLFDTF